MWQWLSRRGAGPGAAWRSLLRRRPSVGVDIGERWIKVVEVRAASATDFTVIGAAVVETPAGAVDGGQVRPEILAPALRKALLAGGIRSRHAVLVVPSHLSFLRRLAVPALNLAEFRGAVALQPERYIPFARSGAVFDLAPAPPGAEAGERWVMLGAAPRQAVADLQQVARLAGLRPVRVDLEALALHRAARAVGRALPGMGVTIVDLGHAVGRISLFDADLPVITRVLDLTREGEHYSLESLEDLFHDVRRALEFALTHSRTPPLRVLITGGKEYDTELGAAMADYLLGFLSNRLPSEFAVGPLAEAGSVVAPAQMLALGLSLTPELFT